MKSITLPIGQIRLNDDNPRLIRDARFAQLVKSLQEFPEMLALRPLVVDESYTVLGGNMRLRAMLHLNYTEALVTVAEGLSEAQKREFVIKDNGSYGEHDWDLLSSGDWPDAATLNDWGVDVPPDWGVVVELPAAKEGEPDLTPAKFPVTVVGDLYELNDHRLQCGDSTDVDAIARLMGDKKADMCFSDPPYGIDWDTDYQRFTGGIKPSTNTYKKIHSDAEEFDPSYWITEFKDCFLFGANCFSDKLPLGNWLIWDKRFENGSAFLADAEAAWYNGSGAIYIIAETHQGFVSSDKKRFHPTQKPVALLVKIFDKIKAPQVLIDPYSGSGSTLMACEQTGRTCYAGEYEPQYADVIIRRWAAYMADNNRPATVKRNGTVLTPAELADFTAT